MDEWISPNGVWKIHRPDGWMIENLNTGFGDSPIVYGDGKVGFDHPEQLPEYIKARFRSMVRHPEDPTDDMPNPEPERTNQPTAVESRGEQRSIETLHCMSVRREALTTVYERIIAQLQGDPFERLIFIQCFAALDASEGHGLAGIYTDEFNRTLIQHQEAMEHDVD